METKRRTTGSPTHTVLKDISSSSSSRNSVRVPQEELRRGNSAGGTPQGEFPLGNSAGGAPQGELRRGSSAGRAPQGELRRATSAGRPPQGDLRRATSMLHHLVPSFLPFSRPTSGFPCPSFRFPAHLKPAPPFRAHLQTAPPLAGAHRAVLGPLAPP